MKKISLNELKIILTPSELKNVRGGTTFWCSCGGGGGSYVNTDTCESAYMYILMACGYHSQTYNNGLAWCDC